MKVYVTDHPHSRIVCKAFADGCGARMVSADRLLDGPAAVYGILRGCGEIIERCQWVGRDFYHIDHGYIGRGHYDGYYRITKNGLQCEIKDNSDFSKDRWEKLGVPIRPWRRTGRKVLVAPISGAVGSFLGIDPFRWSDAVVQEIRLHTDRPVEIKQKHEGSIEGALEDCWCLVTHASNSAVDALLLGVPAVVLGRSAVRVLSWNFENIEKPFWFDREPLFWALANNQWTLDEMRSGLAWSMLNG